MLLDDTRFPLVFLRPHGNAGSSFEETLKRNKQFNDLLDRQTLFVLIADHSDHDHAHETSEGRKAKALFFKRVKERMKAFCLGLIVIEGQYPVNAAARIAALGASKALGFSVQFATDEKGATTKGIALLKRHALRAPSGDAT